MELNTSELKKYSRQLILKNIGVPGQRKIFNSKIGDINIEQRGTNEIVVAKTVEILNNLSKDEKEIKELSDKIKDDLTIDLLAQFSEALRKKYKITMGNLSNSRF